MYIHTETERLLQITLNEHSTDRRQPARNTPWTMIITILCLMLLSLCVDTMIYPFFPITASAKGLTNAEIGFVLSSYDFSRFIASPIIGSLLAKWQPKNLCALGNIITALACIGFGFVSLIARRDIFLISCLVIRLTAGVGSAMLIVSATTILMKSTSYEPSTIAGLIEMMIGAGFTVGPALGSALFQLVGYTGMFCLLGGMMIAFLPVYMIVVPKVVADDVAEKKGFVSLFKIPGCLLIFVHCMMIRINGTARSAGISEYMSTTFGTSSSVVGLLFGLWSTAYIISVAVVTRIIEKRYTFHTMLAGWILLSVTILFIGPSPLLDFIFHDRKNMWLTTIAFTVTYLESSLLFIPPFQAALDQTELNGYRKGSLHTHGMIAGLVNCGLSLGSTVGPVLSGAITDALDFSWTVTCLASTNVSMVVLMTTFLSYMKCTNQPLYNISQVSDEQTNQREYAEN